MSSSADPSAASPIIIGAGPAGMRIARRLAQNGNVLVLDSDTESPGATEARPKLLTHVQFSHAHKGAQARPSLPLAPGVSLLSGRNVVHIDRDNCRILDDEGQTHVYSRLFLALGAAPLRPELPGSQLARVQTLYTRHELNALLRGLEHKAPLLIIGGGLLAVELAALAAKHTSVTLIVRSRLLRRYLEPKMSAQVVQRFEKLGVRVLEQATPQRLLGREGVTGVELADGRQLVTRQVVLACGSAPNTTLASEAGLGVDTGILVDACMRSLSDERIFAVGDCAQPPWPAMRGNITQVLYMADLALASANKEQTPECPAGQYRECRLNDNCRLVIAALHPAIEPKALHKHYYECVNRVASVTMQHHSVVAFQALLPHAPARRLTELWQNHAILSHWESASLQRLVWLPPRRQPDPLICRCASVRRSAVHAAISEYGSDLAMVCQVTQAGNYCGGCLDDIAALCGSNSWQSRGTRWLTVAAILLMVILLGSLPVWPVPDSVLYIDFTAYRLLTSSGIREASGYLLTAVILTTLALRGDRRRYGWHMWLGSAALLLLPLHSLGGPSHSSGFGASLVGLMLLVALSGALLKIRRGVVGLRLGHYAATLALLAATVIHIVFVYQY
ncbi:MAG: FAD-dependent oxidoreductase [Marinobacter sp.]|nr:FAD-dependent oxidoreductase [Marinobacter sp.]